MRASIGFAALTVAALLAGGCSSPSVPPRPAYDVDVRPILMAHCARCHGAGNSLNLPSDLQSEATAFNGFHCFLDRFDDEGDCTSDPANCKFGAAHWAGTIPNLLRHPPLPSLLMPPPPAPLLDDWAVQLLTNWGAQTPAVCSNAPNPDPAICPNGP